MERMQFIFEKLNIDYSSSKEKKLDLYMNRILEKNQYINLTAITNKDEFIQKHYIDSLLCAEFDEFKAAKNIIDVGTGARFPGIPLAIAFPDKEFVLIDSLNKRIKIIKELCDEMGIDNVTAIHGRAEEAARQKDMREKFDICVSRAVANMSTLTEYCLPFVKVGGWFIAYKGPDSEEEINKAFGAVKLLGGDIPKIEKPVIEELPFDHRLVFVNKIKHTISKFPRKAGTPSKEPIK